MSASARESFEALIVEAVEAIGDSPLDAVLMRRLNAAFPAGGEFMAALSANCAEGDIEGWLLPKEAGGLRFGRPVKPGGIAGRFSVDVVRMNNLRGPHHVHTTGEIGALLPIAGTPAFDGFEDGWYVYAPGTDHFPTVSGGEAYIVYFLPHGAIEFTGKS